jgi:integrase
MARIERRETASGEARYRMRVFIGRDESGKRKFVTRTFARKKDAQKEARRLEQMKDMGGALTTTSKESLLKYLVRWLDTKEGQVRARTIHDYRGIVRRYIKEPPEDAPPIGSIRMDRLTPEAFEALYNWLREGGRSPRTIHYTHAVLRMALKDAVAKKILSSNPTDHAKVPKRAKDAGESGEEQTTVRAMDDVQAARFLEAARSDRYYALWAVLLTGGLRPSEALGLKWSAVNLDEKKVYVARSLSRTGMDGWKLLKPKTKKARRTVPLPSVAIQALRQWRKTTAEERLLAGPEYEDNGLVFTTPFGKPLHLANLYRGPWRRVMERAELGEFGEAPEKPVRGPRGKRRFTPAFRMYDLRHTCATLLLLRGVAPKIVQERLGHASITLTMDTYSHVLPTMQQEAADEMEALFG